MTSPQVHRRTFGEIAIACALVAGSWLFAVKPMKERLARDTANAAAHERSLAEWTTALRNAGEAPRDQIERGVTLAREISAFATPRLARDGLYDVLREFADQRGVRLDNVEPAGRDKGRSERGDVASAAVRVQASGPFERVLDFLGDVESLDPTARLDEVQLRTIRSGDDQRDISLTAQLRLYSIRAIDPTVAARLAEVHE